MRHRILLIESTKATRLQIKPFLSACFRKSVKSLQKKFGSRDDGFQLQDSTEEAGVILLGVKKVEM